MANRKETATDPTLNPQILVENPMERAGEYSTQIDAPKIEHPSSEVRVWRILLERSEEETAWRRTLLSPDELARCERFGHVESARRFIVGRSSVRQILAERLGCRPNEVPIVYDGAGKPQLPEGNGWYFNLSHSGEWAVLGVTNLGPIGVDIEKLRLGFAVEPIARRFFSPQEVNDLLSVPVEERHLAFFRCWTRKEAFIKAIGLGLTYPLDEFEVTVLPDDPPAIRRIGADQMAHTKWGVYEVPAPPGYLGALVAPNRNVHLIFESESTI